MDGAEEMVVINTEIPVPDSHWRLRGCRCGSGDVRYVQIRTDGGEPWAVRCFSCGKTGKLFPVQHDAQIYWNGNMAARPIIRRAI